MARLLKRERSKSKGLPPGSLVYIGDSSVTKVKIHVMDYSADGVEETELTRIEECLRFTQDGKTVTWVNVQGLTDPKVIGSIGQILGIQPLWLEDVLNTDHRPKFEELNDVFFILLKSVSMIPGKRTCLDFEQISIFLGKGFVVSFQEKPSEIFDTIKERIRNPKRNFRQYGPDYLFYALIDYIVDNYFSVLENLGGEVEALGNNVLTDTSVHILSKINRLQTDFLLMRRSALPLRDSLAQITRGEFSQIDSKTRMFLHDTYEHAVQIVDVVISYREMLSDLLEIHRSSVNQKMNDVMRVLTIFTSLFAPLTFLVGVYGMNFAYMPELQWHGGYFASWAAMIFIAIAMILFFKRKNWL